MAIYGEKTESTAKTEQIKLDFADEGETLGQTDLVGNDDDKNELLKSDTDTTTYNLGLPKEAGQYIFTFKTAILSKQSEYLMNVTATIGEVSGETVTLKANDLQAEIGECEEENEIGISENPSSTIAGPPEIGLGTKYPYGIATGYELMAVNSITTHQVLKTNRLSTNVFDAGAWTSNKYFEMLVAGLLMRLRHRLE